MSFLCTYSEHCSLDFSFVKDNETVTFKLAPTFLHTISTFILLNSYYKQRVCSSIDFQFLSRGEITNEVFYLINLEIHG